MENYSVCQLQKDMRFEGFLLVRSAEKRKDIKGNDYVDMNLTDRTGEINCKIWNWVPDTEAPETGSAVKVRGTVQEYYKGNCCNCNLLRNDFPDKHIQ